MSGRDEEYDRFVQAEAPRLHRLAFLLCGDWHLADDLVQEALVMCFRHWRRVRRAADPRAYVRRILVNEANRHWKRTRNAAPPSAAGGAEAHAVDGALRVDEQAVLVQTLMALPEGQRAVVVLHHLEDLAHIYPSSSYSVQRRSPHSGAERRAFMPRHR